MPTAAFVPIRLRRLCLRGLVPLVAFGALVPSACSDRVPREDVVPREEASPEAKGGRIASELSQPRTSSWLLAQVYGFAMQPAPCRFVDGPLDAFVTILASIESDPSRDPSQPSELAVVVPSALALHGIDLVVQTCEVGVDLGTVSRVDVMVVREVEWFTHAHGEPRSPSLHILLPQP